MTDYYETVHYEKGDPYPIATAHDTLDDAIRFAEEHKLSAISHIGGTWEDYQPCPLCGEWFDTTDLADTGNCGGCEFRGQQHGF